MPTSYGIGPVTHEELMRDVEQVTATATAEGRDYTIHVSPSGAGLFSALITVHDAVAAPEGGDA